MTFQVNHPRAAPADQPPARPAEGVRAVAGHQDGEHRQRLGLRAPNDLETRRLYQGAAVYGTTQAREHPVHSRARTAPGRHACWPRASIRDWWPHGSAGRTSPAGSSSGRRCADSCAPRSRAPTRSWLATAPVDRLKQGAYTASAGDPTPPAGLQRLVARRLWSSPKNLQGAGSHDQRRRTCGHRLVLPGGRAAQGARARRAAGHRRPQHERIGRRVPTRDPSDGAMGRASSCRRSGWRRCGPCSRSSRRSST